MLKVTSHGHASTALAEGWADRETLDAMAAKIDAWAEQPDAFSVSVHCYAVGGRTNDGGTDRDGHDGIG